MTLYEVIDRHIHMSLFPHIDNFAVEVMHDKSTIMDYVMRYSIRMSMKLCIVNLASDKMIKLQRQQDIDRFDTQYIVQWFQLYI